MAKEKAIKKRNWAFVLYPESAPNDWKDILISTGLPFSISPLHDRDLDPTGEPKKPHYHVILCYPGPTTYNVVRSLTESLNQPIPQAIESVKGYYRYFTHQDNPDKFQYDSKDISSFNGFNYLDYADLTKAEVNQLKMNIQHLIIDNLITEYSDLMDYLLEHGTADEYYTASSNTVFFNSYISSRRAKTLNKINSMDYAKMLDEREMERSNE